MFNALSNRSLKVSLKEISPSVAPDRVISCILHRFNRLQQSLFAMSG